MQLNVQSSFGKARELLCCLISRGLPERLSITLSNHFMPSSNKPSSGFTLVELLVVITLVGILAVGAVVALDGVDDDAKERLTKAEMSELRKALLQFKRDIGHFPGVDSPFPPDESEVLNLLKDCQNDSEPADAADAAGDTYDGGCIAFNIDTGRGWNGPYILPERLEGSVESGYFDAWGNPYRLFDQDDAAPGSGLVRIVSFGADGQDGLPGSPNSSSGDCYPVAVDLVTSDDIVLCLVQ